MTDNYLNNPFVKILDDLTPDDDIRQSLYDVAYEGHEMEEEDEVLSGKVRYAMTRLIVETFKLAKAGHELPKEWKSLLKPSKKPKKAAE